MTLLDNQAQTAAAPYTRPFLTIYDLWVIQLSNRFAWKCPPESMLELYNAHLGHRHLEVGPGSGWYLAHADLPASADITLMDLATAPLDFTRRRIDGKVAAVRTVAGSVLDAVPAAAGSRFDSIGLNFVLHCVPGALADTKAAAVTNLARALTDDGVLFGSTILNPRPQTLFGRALTASYSRVGAFNNADDDLAGLESALASAFRKHTTTQVGDVTLFTAEGPLAR